VNAHDIAMRMLESGNFDSFSTDVSWGDFTGELSVEYAGNGSVHYYRESGDCNSDYRFTPVGEDLRECLGVRHNPVVDRVERGHCFHCCKSGFRNGHTESENYMIVIHA
jgi:hypothetical protein